MVTKQIMIYEYIDKKEIGFKYYSGIKFDIKITSIMNLYFVAGFQDS